MSLQIPTRVRALVAERDGHRGARCDRSVLNVPSSLHHRKPRHMAGSTDPRINDPRNLIRLCGSGVSGCHGEVESQRQAAIDDGWLLRSLDDLDRPLRSVWGVVIRLDASGGRVDEFSEEEPCL